MSVVKDNVLGNDAFVSEVDSISASVNVFPRANGRTMFCIVNSSGVSMFTTLDRSDGLELAKFLLSHTAKE